MSGCLFGGKLPLENCSYFMFIFRIIRPSFSEFKNQFFHFWSTKVFFELVCSIWACREITSTESVWVYPPTGWMVWLWHWSKQSVWFFIHIIWLDSSVLDGFVVSRLLLILFFELIFDWFYKIIHVILAEFFWVLWFYIFGLSFVEASPETFSARVGWKRIFLCDELYVLLFCYSIQIFWILRPYSTFKFMCKIILFI